jgi:hypothetical protein
MRGRRTRIATTDEHQPYLGITVIEDSRNRKFRRGDRTADFGGKKRLFDVSAAVLEAREMGISRNALIEAVFEGESPVNLDNYKSRANKVLEQIGVEIDADNHGVWRVCEI